MNISPVDFRLGLRMALKHPGLTVIGGVGIAVAIAIGVGFFAFFMSALHPRLPLPEGDRLVGLENWSLEKNNEARRALHDFEAWRREMRTVVDVSAFRDVHRNVAAGGATPELVKVAEMTASGFRAARVPPLMGRHLAAEDERGDAPPVVVIGHEAWRTRFAGDPGIVGRAIRLDRTVHTVVGVMPEGYGFPLSHQYWTPLRERAADHPRGEGPEIFIFARLAPGATMEAAKAEMATLGRRSAAAHPETHARLMPQVLPYTRPLLDIQDPGGMGWYVVLMQLMMTLLLMVVTLNVAVLVYARTATRRGEIAVRTALGASRGRIVAQLFAEALVLTTVPAVLGLALAQYGLRQGGLILEQEVGGQPFWTDYSVRPETVAYTLAMVVLAAIVVGVLPALQATGKRVQGDLRQLGGATGMRLGKTWTFLIVAQVAIAVAALPAAVNLGFEQIRGALTRPTFPAREFLIAGMSMESETPPAGEAEARETAARFGARVDELARRLRADAAVAGVSFGGALPGRTGGVRMEVEGVPAPPESPAGHAVFSFGVDDAYFDVFGLRVQTGRRFEARDAGEAGTAVIVSRSFVERVLGGGSAVGRRVRYAAPDEDADPGDAPPERWYEIVGVVDDSHANAFAPEVVPVRLYYPVAPAQVREGFLAVRMRGSPPGDFAATLRRTAAEVDPMLRLGRVRALDRSERQEQVVVRLVGTALFAVLASVLLLSAGGIYALMSFTVTQRRREIGIRSALGASPRRVLRAIFARAAGQVALGVAVGAVGAIGVEHLSGGEMMGGRGAVLLPAIAAVMAVVGLIATFGPARRGLTIQPSEALRADV